MTDEPRPLHFGNHALAVLASTTLGSTACTVLCGAGLLIAAEEGVQGMVWLVTIALMLWFGVFIVALPGAAITLSLLWPVTRRRTLAANCLCVAAGIAAGLLLAPIATPGFLDATQTELVVFALTGGGIAILYSIIMKRMADIRRPGAATVSTSR